MMEAGWVSCVRGVVPWKSDSDVSCGKQEMVQLMPTKIARLATLDAGRSGVA